MRIQFQGVCHKELAINNISSKTPSREKQLKFRKKSHMNALLAFKVFQLKYLYLFQSLILLKKVFSQSSFYIFTSIILEIAISLGYKKIKQWIQFEKRKFVQLAEPFE